MRTYDGMTDRRIPIVMEMMRSIHVHRDPMALVDAFTNQLRKLYGRRGFVALSTQGLEPGEYRILRLVSPDGLVYTGAEAASAPVRRGGILSKIVQGGPCILDEVDLSADPILSQAFGRCLTFMATPLVPNEVDMDWVAVIAPEEEAFTPNHLEEMVVRANLIGALVANLTMNNKLEAANARVAREIEQIAHVQRSLLPESLPTVPGVRLAASYQTFGQAGGDFYDVALLGRGIGQWPADGRERWVVLIGDVSGHGPAAAVVMAMVHSILHAYPVNPAGPGEVLAHVNRHLCAKRIEESFVTAFLGFYEPETRRMVYASAGHNPPLLKAFPHQGDPERLDAVGELPLGIMPDVQYSEAETRLVPGHSLILYTDGIIDARRADGLPFGLEGIEHSLIACTGAPDCAIDHIRKALAAHQQNVRPDDDQTMVVVQAVE